MTIKRVYLTPDRLRLVLHGDHSPSSDRTVWPPGFRQTFAADQDLPARNGVV